MTLNYPTLKDAYCPQDAYKMAQA